MAMTTPIRSGIRTSTSMMTIALVSLAAPAWAQTAPSANQPAAQSAPSMHQNGETEVPADSTVIVPEGDATADTSDPVTGKDEDIVVTGLRAALESAQAIKRNSEQFVDSVTAQDIGRLPDINVAEALQRVPGVQITRQYGEGNGIAVRGLTQVRTELNGRDVFSANGGRGLSWEEVGADLLAGVDVYKNPSAELVEGGLSGTINLRTRLPFDQKGQLIAVTGANTYYDLAGKSGQSLSGLYSNRWHTGLGEFGILANISWQTTSFREDKVVVEPFYQHGPNPTNAAGIYTPIPGFENQQVLAPHGGGFAIDSGDRRRLSIAAAAQWKPASNLEIYGQFFRAKYKFYDQGLSFFSYAGNDLVPVPGSKWTVDEDGIARSGYWSNPSTDSVNYFTRRNAQTTDISGGFKWDVTNRLHFSADYQNIQSSATQFQNQVTVSALNSGRYLTNPAPGVTIPNLNFFFDINNPVPTFASQTPGYYSNLNNYGLTAVLPYAEDNDAQSDAFRADLSWDFDEGSFIRQIRVGGRYTDRTAINRNTTYGTWTAVGSSCANWSSDAGCYTATEFPNVFQPNLKQAGLLRGDGADKVFGLVNQFATSIVTDPAATFAFLKARGQTVGFRPFDDPAAFNGTISEKTKAAYARVAFGAGLFGNVRFDGNAGLRYVSTDASANGQQVLTYRTPGAAPGVDANGNLIAPPSITALQPYGGGRDYEKWLPSLNLRLYLTDRLIIRAAGSKNFARPNFTQLNPSFNLSPTYTDPPAAENQPRQFASTPNRLNPNLPYGPDNPYVGTGTIAGNPDLRPEQVTQADVAVEWYFSKVGYLYTTLFYKKIRDLIQDRNGVPQTREVPGVGLVQFNVSGPINVGNGFVKGLEVGGQTFFDFLPGPLSGLGIQANYTYVDSDAGVQAAGDINSTALIDVPLIGLSKNSYNLVGLYSKSGLNLRVAYNWRGNYLQSTSNTGTQSLPIFGKRFGVLDSSISYDFGERFALTVDGQNLLNTNFQTYQIFENRPRDYVENDRRFTIRFRVRY